MHGIDRRRRKPGGLDSVNGDWAIDVGTNLRGECWGLLASFDVAATECGRVGERIYAAGGASGISTQEAVWRADGFAALLAWIDTELSTAIHVGF